jgi:glyoxylase-like metal-dependent hydrolase (beta-lactamase superfamily II)
VFRTVLAPNPSPMTLDGTRTFVVGSRRPVVIDPGPGHPGHLQAIQQALQGVRPQAILLTHQHPDHAEAAPELARRTGAPVLAWPELAEGAVLETDAGRLQAVHTPGHTPDHLSFLWLREGSPDAMFVGDAFMGGFDTVMVAPPEGSLTDYLETLSVVEVLDPATLYPTHGPPISDGAAAARRYRAHRAERLAQVLAAVDSAGGARPEEMLDAIYGGSLNPELRWAAAGSIQAMLDHLTATGRLRTDQGSYRRA